MVLEGIRVIDWTQWHVGPSAGAMLGDLGAEVIHLEERGQGDPMRGTKSSRGTDLSLPGGRHALFEDLNRNKKSLALNLKHEAGRQVVYRLVEKSDVLLTNYRPQARRSLGLDYPTLSRYNPRLIYASATAFGERGPDGEAGGLELTGYARSGAMLASGDKGMPPVYLSPGVGDRIGGIFLAYGILAALLDRERTGMGQEVTTSQLGAMIALQSASVIAHLLTGQEIPRQRREEAGNPLWNFYRCGDGRWIAFAALQGQRYWPVFCRGLGKPELEKDSLFDTEEKRKKNAQELVALLDAAFATRSYKEWERRFRQAGDIPFTKVNAISDLATDPQVQANEYVMDYDHPALGRVKMVGFPVRFGRTPARLSSPAPELGQHTEELLTEVCGYSWEEVGQLQEDGAI